MAGWKKISTTKNFDQDVDARDFDTAALLQALLDENEISESEALHIAERKSIPDDYAESPLIGPNFDASSDFQNATDAMRRGNGADALHHLARALADTDAGREWMNFLDTLQRKL